MDFIKTEEILTHIKKIEIIRFANQEVKELLENKNIEIEMLMIMLEDKNQEIEILKNKLNQKKEINNKKLIKKFDEYYQQKIKENEKLHIKNIKLQSKIDMIDYEITSNEKIIRENEIKIDYSDKDILSSLLN